MSFIHKKRRIAVGPFKLQKSSSSIRSISLTDLSYSLVGRAAALSTDSFTHFESVHYPSNAETHEYPYRPCRSQSPPLIKFDLWNKIAFSKILLVYGPLASAPLSFTVGSIELTSFTDGGGPSVISQLLIVDEIMHQIKWSLKLDEIPRPCDYAELMVGTGLGAYVNSASEL